MHRDTNEQYHLIVQVYLAMFSYARLIIPISNDITAITKRMCIRLPALPTKKPNSQPITQITATMYSMLLIIKRFQQWDKNLAII